MYAFIKRQLKVKKNNTMIEVMKQIGELLELSIEEIRLWPIMNRYNNTVRPLQCIDLRESAHKTVQDVSKQDSCWSVFVETSMDLSFSNTFDFSTLIKSPQEIQLPPQQQKSQLLPSFNSKEEVMLFFKYYDPKTCTCRYVFRMHVTILSTLSN